MCGCVQTANCATKMASEKATVTAKDELMVQARCHGFYPISVEGLPKKGTVPFLEGLIGGSRRMATSRRGRSPGRGTLW